MGFDPTGKNHKQIFAPSFAMILDGSGKFQSIEAYFKEPQILSNGHVEGDIYVNRVSQMTIGKPQLFLSIMSFMGKIKAG